MVKEQEITRQTVAAELAKILGGETLRGKDTLRALLSYLVERTLDGSAESLKEYTIGVEAFGKPAAYNPQEDASVRVQIGRLRQKLEEYYRTEGAQDALVIELPKRQFALLFHERPVEIAVAPPEVVQTEAPLPPPPALPAAPRRISWPSLLAGALAVAVLWAGWSLLKSREPIRPSGVAASPELTELWQPFLQSERPITMAMTMRPFLRYDRGVIREWNLANLDAETQERRLRELKQLLNTERLVPWDKTYTSFGEATGIFLLTRLFDGYERELQLKRQDALTWEELAVQNVIFVGSGKAGMFERIPVQLAFEQKNNTILNLHPQAGEPLEFKTPAPDPKDFIQMEDYALISVIPGLHGKGEIIAFGGASSSGLWAAVEFMTEPRYARELLTKLKSSTGQLPRHYQVVIHARFQALVPIEIKYVAHREL
jgi:hypothetical protein